MSKKFLTHVAKAIFELDKGCFEVVPADTKKTVTDARTTLMGVLTANGYEFAAPSSARIKKVKK